LTASDTPAKAVAAFKHAATLFHRLGDGRETEALAEAGKLE